jgi:gamma-glutamylcyclotransferase (GGCT)/AIG2-like uncharacterized protein YtfP
MTAARTVLLFSYGTLQHKEVQIATFGRELAGRKDSLPGYVRAITETVGVLYYNIEPSSNREHSVSGTVFEITEQELAAADHYEKDRHYRRIFVALQSGVQAWVYQREERAAL